MAKILKRPQPPAPKLPARATPAKAVRIVGQASGIPHEAVYEMYRSLGPGRSLRRLMEAVQLRWPANPVALGTLANWAVKDGWKRRVDEYEKGLAEGGSLDQKKVVDNTADGEAFQMDDVGVLERAASQALAAALRATSVAVRNPSDVKALVDTANKALELAEKLKQQRTAVATSEEIAAYGAALLEKIDGARRKDFIFMAKAAAEAACAEAGTTNMVAVLKKTAAALGMRVDDGGTFYDLETAATEETAVVGNIVNDEVIDETDETQIKGNSVDGEEDDVVDEVIDETATTVLDLDDVLKQLRGD